MEFASTQLLMVDPEPDKHGRLDVYLDDVLSMVPGLSNAHSLRGVMAVLLAIEVIGCPLAEHEPCCATNFWQSKKHWRRAH